MHPLKIPESEFDQLSLVFRAAPAVLDAVLAAIKDSPPKPRREDLLALLKEKVQGADSKTLAAIGRTLAELYRLKISQELTGEQLAAELVGSASENYSEQLPQPAQGWKAFEAQLAKLLSVDSSMGLAAKATFLAYQGQRHLHSARVLTDARPIFANDPTAAPAAFVVIHTLQLEYHEGEDDKEWFICLDDDDLDTLKTAVDRAIIKRQSLSQMLKRADAPILDWSTSDADDAH